MAGYGESKPVMAGRSMLPCTGIPPSTGGGETGAGRFCAYRSTKLTNEQADSTTSLTAGDDSVASVLTEEASTRLAR
jgi:hypothetical protein